MVNTSATMSQNNASAEGSKRVWSVPNSKFFEHMNDEVPGYGENAKIMYSLHHQKDFVQTGSDHKIQDCTHLFQDTATDDVSTASPSNAAEVSAHRLDLLASSAKGGNSADKTPSPMRRAMSKLKNKLKVDSPRRQGAELISKSVRSERGGGAQPLPEQNPHMQRPRARKWSFSSAASEKQFKTGSATKDSGL